MTPFKIGQVVMAVIDSRSTDWPDNFAARRRPLGVLGTVVAIHDAHGLCYDVQTVDQGVHCYEHAELSESPPRCWVCDHSMVVVASPPEACISHHACPACGHEMIVPVVAAGRITFPVEVMEPKK